MSKIVFAGLEIPVNILVKAIIRTETAPGQTSLAGYCYPVVLPVLPLIDTELGKIGLLVNKSNDNTQQSLLLFLMSDIPVLLGSFQLRDKGLVSLCIVHKIGLMKSGIENGMYFTDWDNAQEVSCKFRVKAKSETGLLKFMITKITTELEKIYDQL